MSDNHDTDDLDFAMLIPPTRHGPCKAATAPEVDPVEARLERERQAAPFFEAAKEIIAKRMAGSVVLTHAEARHVRHGSGKVKV